MNSRSIFVQDSEGNYINTGELAKIFDRTLSHMSTVVRKEELTTLKELVDRHHRVAKSRKPIVYITDTDGSKLTIKDVAEIVGMSSTWVLRAFNNEGCTSIGDFFVFKDKPKQDGSVRSVIKAPKFNRQKICFKGKFKDACKYYSSCTDARLNGTHHDRCKQDGSCYKSEAYDKFTI